MKKLRIRTVRENLKLSILTFIPLYKKFKRTTETRLKVDDVSLQKCNYCEDCVKVIEKLYKEVVPSYEKRSRRR